MGIGVEFVPAGPGDTTELERFIGSLDEELITFRYFENRSFDVLSNHRYTCIMRQEDNTVGYGHLDEEQGIYWLGMVIKKEYQHQGLGRILLNHLIQQAMALQLDHLQLSVDTANPRAAGLYEDAGFKEVTSGKAYRILRMKL